MGLYFYPSNINPKTLIIHLSCADFAFDVRQVAIVVNVGKWERFVGAKRLFKNELTTGIMVVAKGNGRISQGNFFQEIK